MKITRRQLRRIIREESKGSTKKYDDDSALRGKQSTLPDSLQRGIIDKTVEAREEREEEEKEEKNESFRITKRQLRRIVRNSLLESSRAGESHDAGYEDGSHGLDPKHPGDMDYMSGWEMGEEDAQYDAKPPFRGPDPATHKRLRQQTRAQGGYSSRGWKSRTPNE